jgi:hypothetical protein
MTSRSFSSRAAMLVVAMTLGASVADADDSEAFLGRWAENVEWCGTTVDNYTVIDEREINITEDRIDLYVSSCESMTWNAPVRLFASVRHAGRKATRSSPAMSFQSRRSAMASHCRRWCGLERRPMPMSNDHLTEPTTPTLID